MKNATTKLRKKSFTIVEQACHEIHDFSKLYQELRDKVTLSGQTQSPLKNYARKLAQIIDTYGDDFIKQHSPHGYEQWILHAIQICRTSALGGPHEALFIGSSFISYHSYKQNNIAINKPFLPTLAF